MITLGISMIFGLQVPFFGRGFPNGLWLAFIGWFLNSASAQSYQQVVVQDLLEGVPVARLMRSDPPTVSPLLAPSSMIWCTSTSWAPMTMLFRCWMMVVWSGW